MSVEEQVRWRGVACLTGLQLGACLERRRRLGGGLVYGMHGAYNLHVCMAQEVIVCVRSTVPLDCLTD